MPVLNSVVNVPQEVRVDTSFNVSSLSTGATATTKTASVILGNRRFGTPEDRELHLQYQDGTWAVAYRKGAASAFSATLFTTDDASGGFTLSVKADGQTVIVALPNGQTRPADASGLPLRRQ